MNIGSKIKSLRKRRGITQEELAYTIGISSQAVSKWENNVALPDITLAPLLASYFGVSMDELFDFSLDENTREVDEIVDAAYKFRESDPTQARRMLEEGLERYPANQVLMNNLLYVINYTENPDETIALATSLIERNNVDADVKYDALRFLAYAYKAKGEIESAAAAIEQIPEIYFTKLTELAFLLEGEPKRRAAEKQKHISFENLIQMMYKLAECYESDGEIDRAIAELESAIGLIGIIKNKSYDNYVEFFGKQIARLKR